MTWAPDYVTSAQLKSYLRIEGNADDAFIAAWITAVSRNVDDHCGRQFGSVTAEDRTYEGVWDARLRKYVFQIDDVFTVGSMTVEDEAATAIDASDYSLWPPNAPQRGKPYTQLRSSSSESTLIINAPWGWSAVPAAIPTGVYLQGARLAARRDSPYGISGSPQEQGELRLLAHLDPDFRVTLKPYVRKWWAA